MFTHFPSFVSSVSAVELGVSSFLPSFVASLFLFLFFFSLSHLLSHLSFLPRLGVAALPSLSCPPIISDQCCVPAHTSALAADR